MARTPTDREMALALGASVLPALLSASESGRAVNPVFQSGTQETLGSERLLCTAVLGCDATGESWGSAPIYWVWRTEEEHENAPDTPESIARGVGGWRCYNPEVFTAEHRSPSRARESALN